MTRRARASSAVAAVNFNANRAHALGDFAQPGGIRNLPPGVRDVVRIIAMKRETIRVLVHAQQQPPVLAECRLLCRPRISVANFSHAETFFTPSPR